jgi:hypothetical protein
MPRAFTGRMGKITDSHVSHRSVPSAHATRMVAVTLAATPSLIAFTLFLRVPDDTVDRTVLTSQRAPSSI